MTATMSTPLPRPQRDHCVLRDVLERQARERPDRAFIRDGQGREIAYGAFRDAVRRTAAGLKALGVRQDDTVTVWMPNGVDMVRVWFAINWLGAVYVPINVAYRGGLLEHVLRNAGSSVLVASVDLAPRLDDVDRAALTTVVVVGGTAGDALPSWPGVTVRQADALDAEPPADGSDAPPRAIEPWDVQSIIYTSGTTGRSKGVISSYAHLADMSGEQAWPMLGADDCFLLYGPLFHVGGTLPVVASLNRGGTVGIAGEFTTDGFWPAVRATRATFVILLGVMSSFVAKRTPAADDRDHPLRHVTMIPLPDDHADFAQRFGVTTWTLFNMTEINVPIVSGPNPTLPGTCGRQRPGVELRVVDEHDWPVPDGTVGELIVRTDRPWALNSGYFRDPEATARAWRNGWFHTGDAFRRDADGHFFFVDRLKDAIRRRGENISSFEVEVEILAHPLVRECAVVAVPNETAEDDVLAIIATVPDALLEPADLLAFLRPRLAHFMLPRYVRVLPALPRTPTQKVEKHVLRTEGLTPDTWDREAAGVTVTRERLRG